MLHSTTEVTVKLANGQSQVQQIHAGEQIIIDEDGLHPKQNISVELTEKAWNEQMLMINLMPLDQLLNILQTYEKKNLNMMPQPYIQLKSLPHYLLMELV
jgi:transmembrane sensor